jgi:hypothetical protein
MIDLVARTHAGATLAHAPAVLSSAKVSFFVGTSLHSLRSCAPCVRTIARLTRPAHATLVRNHARGAQPCRRGLAPALASLVRTCNTLRWLARLRARWLAYLHACVLSACFAHLLIGYAQLNQVEPYTFFFAEFFFGFPFLLFCFSFPSKIFLFETKTTKRLTILLLWY